MVAGICRSLAQGLPLKEVLHYAVAAATGTVEREGTLLCRASDFERIYPKVSSRHIEI
jgi:1-phosphofructokinase